MTEIRLLTGYSLWRLGTVWYSTPFSEPSLSSLNFRVMIDWPTHWDPVRNRRKLNPKILLDQMWILSTILLFYSARRKLDTTSDGDTTPIYLRWISTIVYKSQKFYCGYDVTKLLVSLVHTFHDVYHWLVIRSFGQLLVYWFRRLWVREIMKETLYPYHRGRHRWSILITLLIDYVSKVSMRHLIFHNLYSITILIGLERW